MWKRLGNLMRRHWKFTAAIILALVAAIVIGALCATPVGAPIVAGIAGLSLFGAVPFAAIGTMGLAAAAACCAGLSAAAVLAASLVFDVLVFAANKLSQWIEPKKGSGDSGFRPSRDDSRDQMSSLRRREHRHPSEGRTLEDPAASSREPFDRKPPRAGTEFAPVSGGHDFGSPHI
jgi:hypothetical protein